MERRPRKEGCAVVAFTQKLGECASHDQPHAANSARQSQRERAERRSRPQSECPKASRTAKHCRTESQHQAEHDQQGLFPRSSSQVTVVQPTLEATIIAEAGAPFPGRWSRPPTAISFPPRNPSPARALSPPPCRRGRG